MNTNYKKKKTLTKIKEIKNKIDGTHWTIKAIVDGLIWGLLFFLIIAIISLLPFWPTNWIVPWIYVFPALIILAIIFELIEKKLIEKK